MCFGERKNCDHLLSNKIFKFCVFINMHILFFLEPLKFKNTKNHKYIINMLII